MVRYYSKNRPVMLGGYPKHDSVTGEPYEVVEIVNYGELRQFDGFMAWGHLDYAEPISERDADAYELVDGRQSTFYVLKARLDASGHVMFATIDYEQHVVQPSDTETPIKSGGIIVNCFFPSLNEAMSVMDGLDWVDGKSSKNLKVKC